MMVNILEFGFREVGKCQLDENLKSGVRFIVNELRDARVIYAYTVDDEVKYIGVCDDTTLKDRMSRYEAMHRAGTKERIAKRIKAHLKKGEQVEILAWKPDVELKLRGVHVDLIKGLEKSLIQEVEPAWNIKG